MEISPFDNLKHIRFEGELLPDWAQLLDLACRLCSMPEDTQRWFSKFTHAQGVEASSRVSRHCQRLRTGLVEKRSEVLENLSRQPGDLQAARIHAAWMYTLDTMIQQTAGRQKCAWQIEGVEQVGGGDAGGDITLRRV